MARIMEKGFMDEAALGKMLRCGFAKPVPSWYKSMR